MQEQYKMGLPTYQKPKGFWTPRASSNAANEVDARVCCCGAKAAAVPARRARVATVFMVRLKRLTMGSRKTGRSSISRKECSFGMSLHAWISLQLRDLFGVCTPPQPRYILCTVYTSTHRVRSTYSSHQNFVQSPVRMESYVSQYWEERRDVGR